MAGGAARGGIAVGTSGWVYDSWRGSFYPDGLPAARWFEHYAARFPTVEVNYSFYRLPSPSTVAGWRAKSPPGFCFALKGSRFVTHVRRMEGSAEGEVQTFIDRVRPLGQSLRVVLWQLPPSLPCDVAALRTFVAGLPSGVRHALEFRHDSWLRDEVFDVLRGHGVALRAGQLAAHAARPRGDGAVRHVRFHGLGGVLRPRLQHRGAGEPWVQFLRQAHGHGLDGYASFNNDALRWRRRTPPN